MQIVAENRLELYVLLQGVAYVIGYMVVPGDVDTDVILFAVVPAVIAMATAPRIRRRVPWLVARIAILMTLGSPAAVVLLLAPFLPQAPAVGVWLLASWVLAVRWTSEAEPGVE